MRHPALPLAAVALLAAPALSQGDPAEGFTLLAPLSSTSTYLLDHDGTLLHTWPSSDTPGNAVYLLENGNLLRTIHTSGSIGGSGGGVQEIAGDGTLVWDFRYDSTDHLSHHDVEGLPNGNVLMIAWEHLTAAEAIAQGRNPAYLNGTVFSPDHIIEVEPTGASSGAIVWEWHAWDHLVQDYDATKPNYGVVSDHPELIDLNFPASAPKDGDWIHANGIDYDAALDQIVLSSRTFSEIWIIDHSTTTAEAAGHTGGNHGRGGDLLYRWGNPQAYDRGTSADQQLFGQHDPTWIADGSPGEGNILLFNNGSPPAGPGYSAVVEIETPVDANGDYPLGLGAAYGPATPTWSYTAPNPTDFYSSAISGAERQPNGNTLICCGGDGWIFEVDSAGNIVWEYTNSLPNPMRNSVFKVRRYRHYLFPEAEAISASLGGSVEFHLEAGTERAHRTYLLAATMSGTSPGTPLPGGLAPVPLNYDYLTGLVLAAPTGPTFVDFLGLLDATGSATARLDLLAPLDSSLVGLTAHFAYAVFPPWDFASNAMSLVIEP